MSADGSPFKVGDTVRHRDMDDPKWNQKVIGIQTSHSGQRIRIENTRGVTRRAWAEHYQRVAS